MRDLCTNAPPLLVQRRVCVSATLGKRHRQEVRGPDMPLASRRESALYNVPLSSTCPSPDQKLCGGGGLRSVIYRNLPQYYRNFTAIFQ